MVEGVDVYAPDKPTHAFAGIYATARAHRAHAHKHTKTYTNTTHTHTHTHIHTPCIRARIKHTDFSKTAKFELVTVFCCGV